LRPSSKQSLVSTPEEHLPPAISISSNAVPG
jgi:hypothetical protein